MDDAYSMATELSRRLDIHDFDKNLFISALELVDGFCSQVSTDSFMIDLTSRILLKMAKAEGVDLSTILEVWKRYLPFLKMYYFAIDPEVCDGFVSLLHDAILTSVEGLRNHVLSDGAGMVDAKTCGVTNFLCQRMSASISYFMHGEKISNVRASAGLGAIALSHRVLADSKQTSEILNKYHNFIGKALRPPEVLRNDAVAPPMSNVSISDTGQSMLSSSAQSSMGFNSSDNSIVISILRGTKSTLFEVKDGEEDEDNRSSENVDAPLRAQTLYSTAWLLLKDLQSTLAASSSSCSLKLDHTRVHAYLDFVLAVSVSLSTRYLGEVSDVQVTELINDTVKCLVDARRLFVQLQQTGSLVEMHSFLLSLSCQCENDVSVSRVKSELARWVFCGYLRAVGGEGQAHLVEAFKAFVRCSMAELETRDSDLSAVCLTARSMLLVMADPPAMDLLVFLKQADDGSSMGHFKAAVWAQVPLSALHGRGGKFASAVKGLLSSSCSMVLAAQATAVNGSSDGTTGGVGQQESLLADDKSKRRLGQAVTVLSSYGPSFAAEHGCGHGKEACNPLIDLSAVSNRGVVQYVLRVLGGCYCRLLDKQYEQPHISTSLSVGKTTAVLKTMHDLLGCLLGQTLPVKIQGKLLTTAQVAASLSTRLATFKGGRGTSSGAPASGSSAGVNAGTDAVESAVEGLGDCLLAASQYCFRCIRVCCRPTFPPEEFDKTQAIYHSLVKACEVLSRDENRRCNDLALRHGKGGSNTSPRTGDSGWQIWCELQESLGLCVAAFPSREMQEAKAKLLIPAIYRPFMGARHRGRTATINAKQECSFEDTYAALVKQHDEAGDGSSVLHAAAEYSWWCAVARGGGKENDVATFLPIPAKRRGQDLGVALGGPLVPQDERLSKRAKTA